MVVVENTPTSTTSSCARCARATRGRCSACHRPGTKAPPTVPGWVAEPRAVLREFGVELPEDTEIRVWDSTSEVRYLVLPRRPGGTDSLSEEQLAALVTRDSMIGTGLLEPGS